jgi:undecaprenyl-diphosphatase
MFRVVIQFGAILAVVTLYFQKLNPFSRKKLPQQRTDTYKLWLKVIIATIPAAIIGFLFEKEIDNLLMNDLTVGITLILYGLFFIVLETFNKKRNFPTKTLTDLSYKTALVIGLFQILALIPGTSRSGTTILGAMLIGCSRYVSAEFSFFLAIPVMLGASGLKIIEFGFEYSSEQIVALIIGTVVAYAVSIFALRFLVQYVKKHDFKGFGYYRIAAGIVVLGLIMYLAK